MRGLTLGVNPGANLTTGSQTVMIGGAQTRAFIAGIRGRTTALSNAVSVLIDSAGQLGTAAGDAWPEPKR